MLFFSAWIYFKYNEVNLTSPSMLHIVNTVFKFLVMSQQKLKNSIHRLSAWLLRAKQKIGEYCF